MIEVSPSLLSADFSCVAEAIKRAENGGAGSFHLDIMDGHFVPNITMGPVIVRGVRKCTNKRLDGHLMIAHPSKYAKLFISAGCDVILIHVECDDAAEAIKIARKECMAGVVINPETPISVVKDYIAKVDYILIMSVKPGFSGQRFMPEILPKIRLAKRYAREHGIKIMVDGGINLSNVGDVVAAGADIIVAASSIFGSGNITDNVRRLLYAANSTKTVETHENALGL